MSGELSPYNSAAIAPADEQLSDAAKAFAVASMASNTKRAYRAQWKLWTAYATRVGCEQLPASPFHVANWLAERAKPNSDDGATLSTVRTAVAADRSAHQAAGLHFDTAHPSIKSVTAGIARKKARLVKQATPLRPNLIANVLETLTDEPVDLRDAALLALGYMFALRRSEAAGIDLGEQGDGDSVLYIEPDEIRLVEIRGKTLRPGEQRERVVPRHPNAPAVALVERWIAVAGIQPGQALLRSVAKGGKVGPRLSDQNIAWIIKRRLFVYYTRHMRMDEAAAEAAVKAYSGHSLRVGFAVAAADGAADIGAITRAGGWRGPAMPIRYTERAEQRRTSPHLKPGVGLSSYMRGSR